MGGNAGTGPGEITSDGCAVELYTLLPSSGEAATVHAAVPAGASILELGCGTGRILRPLAGLGHRVHGVDDSAGMLARLSDLPATCAPIESLRLDETFDVVLLASTLLNTGPRQRRAFLATCRHHLAGTGEVVFQYHPPAWFDTFPDAPRDGIIGEIAVVVRTCRQVPAGIACELEYRAGSQTWTHAWTSYRISDAELTADLAAADLAFGRWLTADHAWFTARAA